MEVFFLDVAQGTCQVILLGQRRAIVLDCGLPRDRFVLQFLQRMGVEYLDCLIVSHSHSDHLGGAVSILGEYRDRIARICVVQDSAFLRTAFWHRLSELVRDGTLPKDRLIRLERTGTPQLVWSDGSKSARLQTYSPTAAENILAQDAGNQNATSAVLFLVVRGERIVFAADSEVSQWREIRHKAGKRISCKVLAVPHHAGALNCDRDGLNWLFDEALSVEFAVISVGTNNTNGHPRPEVVQAMVARGTKVLCTQITRACSINLESLRPGVLRPLVYPGRSSPTRVVAAGSGNSRNVACAGTIRATVTVAGIQVDRWTEHQQAVDRLAQSSTNRPLCR